MRGFFGKPNLGGMLVILNCLLWGVLTLASHWYMSRGADGAMLAPLLILSLPAALPFVLMIFGSDGRGAIVISVIIGVNSLLWGYGMASLWSMPRRIAEWRKDRRRLRGLCVVCGYDLRASENRCPECGTPIDAVAKNHLGQVCANASSDLPSNSHR